MELQVSSDYSEKTYSGTVEASNFVTATYLGTESNRRYPPDVRKMNKFLFLIIAIKINTFGYLQGEMMY